MIWQILKAVRDRFFEQSDERERGCTAKEGKMWDAIASNHCPDCKAKGRVGVVATGGLALNVRCFNCNVLFWVTPERVFGVKRLDGNMTELRESQAGESSCNPDPGGKSNA